MVGGTHIDKLGGDETYVLGDYQAVSMDSRVVGTLPKEYIVRKPVARIWPLNRFSVGSLNINDILDVLLKHPCQDQ